MSELEGNNNNSKKQAAWMQSSERFIEAMY